MPYCEGVDLTPIIVTSISIALYRGVAAPSISKYRAWRDGPRVRTARRNWRGVYVPDLTIKRIERLCVALVVGVVLFGVAVCWTVMVRPG